MTDNNRAAANLPTPVGGAVAPNGPNTSRSGSHLAPKTRIVILGGGFGGVYTARCLEKLLRRRPDVEIVLVSRDNFLLMTPLLFEVFSGTLDPRHCSFPIRAFLGTTRFGEAGVRGIDLDRRVVHLAAPAPLPLSLRPSPGGGRGVRGKALNWPTTIWSWPSGR